MEDIKIMEGVNGEVMGSVVYGSYSSCDFFALANEWKAQGLSEEMLLPMITPKVAVKRAMNELTSRRTLARCLGKGKGYALINESATEDDLEYSTDFKVVFEGGMPQIQPEGHPAAATFYKHYTEKLKEVTGTDLSVWVRTLIFKLKGSRLRERGGVYFVPSDNLETFRRMTGVLEKVSGSSIFELPAVNSEQAVKSVLASITTEAEEEIATFEALLNPEDGQELGERAMKTKAAQIEELIEKVEKYAEILGTNLDKFKDKLEELHSGFAMAACVGMLAH